MKKIFYNKTTNHEIVDISGQKNLDQIKFEFGGGNYEEALLSNGEGYRIKNEKIEKYDIASEQAQDKVQKESEKTASLNRIKSKLNLSNQDIDDLRKAL